MKRLLSILILFCVPAFGTTYYVSFSTGADTNTSTQAQSKSTPWKNLRGMLSATSNAASYTPVAGDSFILMGCDDWPNASFPVNWSWSGTSGAHITIGVDQTWYNTTNCPSGWNRPKWDAGSAVIDPPECTNNNGFFEIGANSYVDVNWIELINYHWTSNQAGGSCFSHEFWVSASNSASNITWNFSYIHSWGPANGADDIDHGFLGCSETCAVTYMVADNSDGTIHTGIGMQWPTQNSIINDVSNALKPNNSGTYAYNDISHVAATGSPIISTSVHPNCIETITTLRGSGNVYIHDNRIHDADNGSSGGAGGCEGLQVGNPGETDYVWNNIWYNMTVSGANGPDLPQNSNNSVAFYYWNNINVDQRNYCIGIGSNGNKWSSAFVAQNNHCITAGTPSGSSQSGNLVSATVTTATTITFGNNLVESLANANASGYTNAQSFVYSPTSGGSPTVGAGINLFSSWPAGFSTNDTTYACTEGTVGGVVESVCPARTTNSRPSSGAWDLGAYEFAVTTQNLTVTVSGIGAGSVTSSPAGANCPAICTPNFTTGTSVTLTATPNSGSYFYGWSNAGCSGTSTCTIVMSSAQAVTALFIPAPLATGPYPGYAGSTSVAIVQPPATPNFGNLTNNGATFQDSSYPNGVAAMVIRCTDHNTTASTVPNQSLSAGLGGSGDAVQMVSAGSTLAHINNSGGDGFLIPITYATPVCGPAITANLNLTNPGSATTAYNFGAGSFDWVNPAVWYTFGGNNDTSNTQIVSYTFNASNQFTVNPLIADFQYGLPLGSNVGAWQASHAYTQGAYVSYAMQSSDSLRPFDWQATYALYQLGDIIKPSVGNPSGCGFKLIGTGTTSGTEPTWGSTCSGANITDGSAQWSGILGPPTFVYNLTSSSGTSGGSTPHFVPTGTGHPDIATTVTDSSLTWMNVGPDITDLQAMWASFAGVSRDGTRFCTAFSSNAYGYNGSYTGINADQGTGIWSICYNTATNNYYLLNTITGVQSLATCSGGTGYNCSGGTFSLAPQGIASDISTGGCGFFIHNNKGTPTMDYPVVSIQGSYLAGSSGCGSPESVWQPFAAFNSTTAVQNVLGGWNHWTLGYNHGVNLGQSGSTFGFTTGAYEQIFDLTNPGILADILIGWQPTCDVSWTPNDPLPPCQFSLGYDSHMGWAFNPQNADNTPVCGTVYNLATISPIPVAPWQGEEVCISTSPSWANGSPAGAQQEWRFTHTFASGTNPSFNTQFQISEMSGDGTLLLFSSDMWNPATQTCGLGSTAGGSTSLCGAPWIASTVYASGAMVNPFSSTGGSGTNYGVYEVTTPGTSASSAPAWFVCNSGTAGNTVTDSNGVVYTCQGTGNARGDVFLVKLSRGTITLVTAPTNLMILQ